MSSLWRFFDKAWAFTLPSFLTTLFSPISRSYSLSFGCWLRISSRDVGGRGPRSTKNGSRTHYLPLEDAGIRVFVLHPGAQTDVLSGHMQNCAKWGRGEGNTSFEALSYVWGYCKWKDAETILVNGDAISVTTSLRTALFHLRYPDRPRTLWIDDICINQNDDVEKSKQVAMMGNIYEAADSVLIWLGLASPYSPVGMEVLRYFANEKRPHSHPVWQTYPQALVLEGLQDVLTRPWFSRMWVVQEIGRSHHAKLICERDCVEWQSTDPIAVRRFVRMIKYAEILPEWTQLGLDKVNMRPLLEMLDYQNTNQFTRGWGTSERPAPDLLDLAHRMRHKKCSFPHDKIFGIWGLVEYMDDLEDFKVDYRMPVKELYEEVARVCFKESTQQKMQKSKT